MFCQNCGNPLSEDGICKACAGNAEKPNSLEPEAAPEENAVVVWVNPDIEEPIADPAVESAEEPIAEPVEDPVAEPAQEQGAPAWEESPERSSIPVVEGVINPAAASAADPGKGEGIVSLILGIIAIIFGSACSCFLACLGGMIPLGCAVVGIVLGRQAVKKSRNAGFTNTPAQVGTILCGVAIGVIVVFIIINAVVGGVIAYNSYF